jgi:hypothetical protein
MTQAITTEYLEDIGCRFVNSLYLGRKVALCLDGHLVAYLSRERTGRAWVCCDGPPKKRFRVKAISQQKGTMNERLG